MATLYIKYAKKCEKMFFFQIINGHGLLKSVAQAALKCPKPLFCISLFKKCSAIPIDRHV